MNIHEYQAKAIFSEYGIPVPEGKPALSIEEARAVIAAFGDCPVAIKAQIHAGGRGKAGGVKLAGNASDAVREAEALLGKTLYTKQTGGTGKTVRRLLIEKQSRIIKEYYLGMALDSKNACVTLIATSAGGMSVEETAQAHPEKLFKCPIDPYIGLRPYQTAQAANFIGIPAEHKRAFAQIAAAMYRLFIEKDCSLVEINPLALTENAGLVALDAKVAFDESAFFRHAELAALRDRDEEGELEATAADGGMNYVSLGGDIGCMVIGAGMGMSTMDSVRYFGGRPANFMDCGGSVDVDKAKRAFEILLSEKGLRAIIVNIFGGITRVDLIAEGIALALNERKPEIPVIVRLDGSGADKGRETLAECGFPIHAVKSLSEAAKLAVSLTGGAK